MGLPVVVAAAGGLPVIVVTNGLPVTLSTNGYGLAVTQSSNGYGLPVTGVTFGPTIALSSASVLESAAVNTTVGTLSVTPGTTGTPVFTLADSAGGKFNILGTALRTNAALDYETATSHTITVAVSGVTPTVANATFIILVGDVAGPAAPVLVLLTDATDSTPDFTLTGDLVLADTVRFQYSTSAVFGGASELTNTIDAAEDAANAISFTTGSLANGTWYFRARIERGTENSGWSNTVIDTIAVTTSAEVSQFLTRTTGLDGAHTAAYTAFIDGLVADGIWSKFDAIYLFATDTTTNARLNVKSSSFAGTLAGSPVFTANRGYGFPTDGIDYINTNLNATTSGGQYTLNNAHMSVWLLTQPGGGATPGLLVLAGGDNEFMLPNYGLGGTAYYRVNCGPGLNVAVADGIGHTLGNRSSSAAMEGYRNGTQIVAGASTAYSALHNSNFTIPDVATGTWEPGQTAAASFGASLSSGQVTAYYNRLRTYMTAMGVP